MDPLAHTLVGATLAEAGLGRKSRYATAVTVIGANLPDIDVIASAIGTDEMYGFRRGWTHGVLAMLVWPFVLLAFALLWDRWAGPSPTGARLHARNLLGVATLAVLSHPLLDWLNTYGVRLLMPFSDRWFYGDALFIVDPWLWLSMSGAVVLSRSRSRLGLLAWSILGLASSGLILGSALVGLTGKLLWSAAIVAIVWSRVRLQDTAAPRVARALLVLMMSYSALMIGGSFVAARAAQAHLDALGIEARVVMAGPLPANPFVRDVIARSATHYHFVEADLWAEPRLTESHAPIPRGQSEHSERARHCAGAQGFFHWLRFPAYQSVPSPEGHTVTVSDVRYSRMGAGIGRAVITLDEEGQPVGAELGSP
jgi:inner membrane protein